MRRVHRARRQYPRGFLYFPRRLGGRKNDPHRRGRAKGNRLSRVQQAYVDAGAVQCGFCTPGIIMSAVEIVGSGKQYTREELRKLISGHLCRCTGYQNILNAVERAVDEAHRFVGKGE